MLLLDLGAAREGPILLQAADKCRMVSWWELMGVLQL